MRVSSSSFTLLLLAAAGPAASFLLPRPLSTTLPSLHIDHSSTALNVRVPCLPDQGKFVSATKGKSNEEEKWYLPHWPNMADFRFNYHNLLLKSASKGRIAQIRDEKTVAVVGAGIAGMTAARELMRCGFKVDIYEASPRIGGRLYTSNHHEKRASMELGAMRMPFFKKMEDPDAQPNSVLEYYLETEPRNNDKGGITKSPFPNPGQTPPGTVDGTGIYVNRGLGTNVIDDDAPPKMISWSNKEGSLPNDEFLQELTEQVNDVIKDFQGLFSQYYIEEDDDWDRLWGKVTEFYDNKTFNDLARLDRAEKSVFNFTTFDLEAFTGDLGGFGLTKDQSDMLYTIGIGDGSWGAFYSIASLWFLRCTIFGFGSQLQTIEQYELASTFQKDIKNDLKDADENSLPEPTFEGIQSMVEYLYYVSPENSSPSMHDSPNVKLRVSSPVERLKYTGPGVNVSSKGKERHYDYAVVTTTTHASQISMRMVNFAESQLPQEKRTHSKTQHQIASLKLFFPLNKMYWKKEVNPTNLIPQIIITDTFIQDAYALEWSTKDKAVLLASYTWEADALKLASFDTEELAKEILERFDEITTSTCGGQKISDHVDKDSPFSFEWIKQPTYMGCSKLYRPWSRDDNLNDLGYNQNFGERSNLYFCGENYSVEGGWTEPALRSALDCVVQINKHAGSTFTIPEMNQGPGCVYPEWKRSD